MSENDFRTMRPPGEVLVEVYRPPLRFGLAIALAVRDHSGDLWYAQPNIDGSGSLVWDRSRPDIQHAPLMFIDEDVASALYKALNKEPVHTRGDLTLDHLRDTIATRDRLLGMVEQAWKLMQEPRIHTSGQLLRSSEGG